MISKFSESIFMHNTVRAAVLCFTLILEQLWQKIWNF